MNRFKCALCWLLVLVSTPSLANDSLRILTWDGYVTSEDLKNVNRILREEGYSDNAVVISPYAEDAEQMFNLLRNDKADIAFLTLFFIKLQGEKSSKVIQPVNVNSPRLGNYRFLLPSLTRIPMGMKGEQPLYIPFAGGTYGFYVDRAKVPANDVPKSWADLLRPEWQGRYSLNRSQIWYNVAIAAMALGKAPYYLNSLALEGKREQLVTETRLGGPLDQTLTKLYRNAGHFWTTTPQYLPNLAVVSSWGMDVNRANQSGGDWQLIHFREGNLVWLDTINFASKLTGRRLEAAEIVANYFIGKEVQRRVATELSLVAVSTLSEVNPILSQYPDFFQQGTFVPPYDRIADNFMTKMSNAAMSKIGQQK